MVQNNPDPVFLAVQGDAGDTRGAGGRKGGGCCWVGAPGRGSGAVQGEQGPRELVLDSFFSFSKELGEFWLSPCLGGPWGGLEGALHPPTAPVGLFWGGQHSQPLEMGLKCWGGSVGWGRHSPQCAGAADFGVGSLWGRSPGHTEG